MAAPARNPLLTRLARDLNFVVDADRAKRLRGLRALSTALFEAGDAPVAGAAVDVFVTYAEVHRPIVAAFADSGESVREAAVALVSRIVEAEAESRAESPGAVPGAELVPVVPTLLAAISARVGRLPFPEESEEVRLHLATLLSALVSRPATAAALLSHPADLVDTLRSLASDAFHSVRSLAAAALVASIRAAPATAASHPLQLHVSPLTAAFLPSLAHQRGPVRVAALEVLQNLLPLGGESLPRLVSETVLPALKALRFDRTPGVRRQLACTAGRLLIDLPSFALAADATDAHLQALLLGLAADEAAEVVTQALDALSGVAAAAATSSSASTSLPAAARAAGGAGAAAPAPVAAPLDVRVAAAAAGLSITAAGSAEALAASGAVGVAGDDSSDDDGDVTMAASGADGAFDVTVLPPHFPLVRPSRSLRRYVRRHVAAIVPVQLADLRDWTSKVRVYAAGGLRSLFAIAERALTAHFDAILGALCVGSRDDDADVKRLLGDVSRQVGVYIAPEVQLSVLLPQLRGEVSGLNLGFHHASALAVLAAALSTIRPAALLPHLEALVATLAMPHLAEDDPPSLRRQLASVARNLAAVIAAGGGAAAAAGTATVVGATPLPGRAAGPTGVRRGRLLSTAEPLSPQRLAPSSDSPTAGAASGSSEVASAAAAAEAEIAEALAAAAAADRVAVEALTAGGAVLSARVLDDICRVCLHLNDPAADEGDAAIGRDVATAVARHVGLPRAANLFALAMHRLLPPLLADVATWSRASPHRRTFETLLRTARPGLSGRSHGEADALVGMAVDTLITTLSPSRDPELRVAQLATLEQFLNATGAALPPLSVAARRAADWRRRTAAAAAAGHLHVTGDSDAADALRKLDVAPMLLRGLSAGGYALAAADAPASADGDVVMATAGGAADPLADHPFSVSHATVDAALAHHAPRLLRDGIIPSCVWRAGAVAATIRKVALACVQSLLTRALLMPEEAVDALPALLPILRGCSSDEDASTRLQALHILSQLLALLAADKAVTDEQCRDLYPDLLKRLDDSADAVRIAACETLGRLAAAVTRAIVSGGPVQYTIDALLVHLDDTEVAVQQAAFGCLVAWVEHDEVYARRKLLEARERHRSPALCDRLLAALSDGAGGGAEGGATAAAAAAAAGGGGAA